MKKMFILMSFIVLASISLPAMAGNFYIEYDNYRHHHPYHRHYHRYNGGHLYCSICGLYHHPDHHHFYHHTPYYDRPVLVEHGRSIESEYVTETREIVE